MGSIRVRLVFDQKWSRLGRKCWFVVDPSICHVLADLEYLVRMRFDISGNVNLYLDGYLLPSQENIVLLRDGDLIRVREQAIRIESTNSTSEDNKAVSARKKIKLTENATKSNRKKQGKPHSSLSKKKRIEKKQREAAQAKSNLQKKDVEKENASTSIEKKKEGKRKAKTDKHGSMNLKSLTRTGPALEVNGADMSSSTESSSELSTSESSGDQSEKGVIQKSNVQPKKVTTFSLNQRNSKDSSLHASTSTSKSSSDDKIPKAVYKAKWQGKRVTSAASTPFPKSHKKRKAATSVTTSSSESSSSDDDHSNSQLKVSAKPAKSSGNRQEKMMTSSKSIAKNQTSSAMPSSSSSESSSESSTSSESSSDKSTTEQSSSHINTKKTANNPSNKSLPLTQISPNNANPDVNKAGNNTQRVELTDSSLGHKETRTSSQGQVLAIPKPNKKKSSGNHLRFDSEGEDDVFDAVVNNSSLNESVPNPSIPIEAQQSHLSGLDKPLSGSIHSGPIDREYGFCSTGVLVHEGSRGNGPVLPINLGRGRGFLPTGGNSTVLPINLGRGRGFLPTGVEHAVLPRGRDRWTNRSHIMTNVNHNGDQVGSGTFTDKQGQSEGHTNGTQMDGMENGTENKETDEIESVRDFSECSLLCGPPRAGDRIAYKMLELSASYTPEMSGYKEGMVLGYDPTTNQVSLELTEASLAKPTGDGNVSRKFELSDGEEEEDEDAVEKPPPVLEKKVSVPWMSMVEPRLVT